MPIIQVLVDLCHLMHIFSQTRSAYKDAKKSQIERIIAEVLNMIALNLIDNEMKVTSKNKNKIRVK